MENKKGIMSETDAKEILANAAKDIQVIDERIAKLKEDRKEIVKTIKDKGLSSKLLNKAISEIRNSLKYPMEEDELTLYIHAMEDIITLPD